MSKRRYIFIPHFHIPQKLEFPFLQDVDEVEKIFRTLCKSVFSIKHGGRSDMLH